MVFLNGKPFPIYGIDTQEARKNRVAWMLKTHPNFVSTEPEDLLDLLPDTNILAHNLIDLIKEDVKEGDFPSFYENIKDSYKVDLEVLLYTWFQYFPNYQESIDILTMTIEDAFPNINIEKILSYKGHDQTDTIQSFLRDQQLIEKRLQEFSSNIIPVEMGELDVQKITFEVVFRLDVDLIEIFDRLHVSADLPYVNNGGDRHKIYKDFKNIGENWEFGRSDMVSFYVLNTKFPPFKFNEKAYSAGVIALSEKKGEAIMDIETVVGAKNNLESLIERVFSSLGIERSSVVEIREHSINSTVNIPKQRFNKYIMADVIVNDPLVSTLCYIDESAKIGRIRSGISFFYHPVGAEGKVTISFTESQVELKEYRKNPRLYPMDSRYIRVHINRVKNKAMAEQIVSFIGRIFKIYLDNKDSIASVYTKFIPDFVELEDKKIRQYTQRGSRLQDIIPEIFIPGYARACQRPPTIGDTLIKNPSSGYIIENPTPQHTQAMLFPKTADEGPQHWYVCPPGKYPGLRVNNMANSGQFPYLPCCYPIDQTGKKNYKNYYLEYGIKDTQDTFTHILTTPKFLSKGELGTIPLNLDTLLQNLMKGTSEFYRTGSPLSPTSFIDAVSIAMGKQIDKSKITLSMFTACRQNAYNMTVEQLRDEFMNGEQYINPSIYYRALEEYFKCYIYLFTRTSTNHGAVVYPLHKHAFLRFAREKRPVILILEHTGAESDVAQYPQCEVIIKVDGSVKTAVFTDDFADELERVYKNTIEWYSGTAKIKETNMKDMFRGIISQGIDAMGKTRTLAVKSGNSTVHVLTDPLPTFTVPEKSVYVNNTIEAIQDFIKREELETVSVTPDRYTVRKNGYTYYLPYKVIRSSTLSIYNHNQRIARYLQEYAYYMYSQYATENGMNPNNINNFLREKTIVKKDYEYPKITRKFDLKGPYLTDGRLIVHNLEMAQRLGFSIELLMRRNSKKLAEYRTYELIQDYYLDKNDFTPDNNAVILMTDEALRNWITEKSVEYNLLTLPTKDEDIFYLSLKGQIVLIQKAETFESAVNISRTWNEQGYNTRSVVEDIDSNYSYYLFESPKDIAIHGNSKNKVLVWREDDELYYGAILV